MLKPTQEYRVLKPRILSVKTKNTAEWGELIAVCAFLSQLSQSLPLPPSLRPIYRETFIEWSMYWETVSTTQGGEDHGTQGGADHGTQGGADHGGSFSLASGSSGMVWVSVLIYW